MFDRISNVEGNMYKVDMESFLSVSLFTKYKQFTNSRTPPPGEVGHVCGFRSAATPMPSDEETPVEPPAPKVQEAGRPSGILFQGTQNGARFFSLLASR